MVVEHLRVKVCYRTTMYNELNLAKREKMGDDSHLHSMLEIKLILKHGEPNQFNQLPQCFCCGSICFMS